MRENHIFNKLIEVQKQLLALEMNHYFLQLKEEHVTILAQNVQSYQRDYLSIEKFREPRFSEELKVDRKEIFEKFHFFNEEKDIDLILEKLKLIPINDVLVVLGQRITPASVKNEQGIPPIDDEVFKKTFKPYNKQLSKGLRACEKHSERVENSFWGKIEGNPNQKEERAREVVKNLLFNKTWWNVYYHYKHELVYEVRISSGHGARWKLSNLEFIGFVEPLEIND
ncbi:hypothetical protein SAMN04489761_2219 [Tenacibaculum sp. MAR_2009_124]|uniref:hypothetical protein n=1 Tax=Tenacibaculum sp. MAR_2009_124 TaxID=1250059 RepID=UPI00089CB0F1|nr:hypothetical protein [Tenacibaculum sp. MAR_2009_124]SEC00224.1 hypothetical protein SAMN04489761_2219 [Tenacibaculum sp. MAR_2009_124]